MSRIYPDNVPYISRTGLLHEVSHLLPLLQKKGLLFFTVQTGCQAVIYFGYSKHEDCIVEAAQEII